MEKIVRKRRILILENDVNKKETDIVFELLALPEEIIEYIMLFMSPKDLFSTMRCNKYLNNYKNNKIFWELRFGNDFEIPKTLMRRYNYKYKTTYRKLYAIKSKILLKFTKEIEANKVTTKKKEKSKGVNKTHKKISSIQDYSELCDNFVDKLLDNIDDVNYIVKYYTIISYSKYILNNPGIIGNNKEYNEKISEKILELGNYSYETAKFLMECFSDELNKFIVDNIYSDDIESLFEDVDLYIDKKRIIYLIERFPDNYMNNSKKIFLLSVLAKINCPKMLETLLRKYKYNDDEICVATTDAMSCLSYESVELLLSKLVDKQSILDMDYDYGYNKRFLQIFYKLGINIFVLIDESEEQGNHSIMRPIFYHVDELGYIIDMLEKNRLPEANRSKKILNNCIVSYISLIEDINDVSLELSGYGTKVFDPDNYNDEDTYDESEDEIDRESVEDKDNDSVDNSNITADENLIEEESYNIEVIRNSLGISNKKKLSKLEAVEIISRRIKKLISYGADDFNNSLLSCKNEDVFFILKGLVPADIFTKELFIKAIRYDNTVLVKNIIGNFDAVFLASTILYSVNNPRISTLLLASKEVSILMKKKGDKELFVSAIESDNYPLVEFMLPHVTCKKTIRNMLLKSTLRDKIFKLLFENTKLLRSELILCLRKNVNTKIHENLSIILDKLVSNESGDLDDIFLATIDSKNKEIIKLFLQKIKFSKEVIYEAIKKTIYFHDRSYIYLVVEKSKFDDVELTEKLLKICQKEMPHLADYFKNYNKEDTKLTSRKKNK